MVIATFGPSTGWVGKTITYDDEGRFTLEGVGPLTAAQVLDSDSADGRRLDRQPALQVRGGEG